MSVSHFDNRSMDYEGCLDRLRSTGCGRVSVFRDGLPFILPVTFKLGEERLVIHTVNEVDIVPLTRDRMVAFEADSFSMTGGWSVNVIGFAHAVDPHPHRRYHPDGDVDDERRSFEITLDMVAGQVFVPAADDFDLRTGSPFRAMSLNSPPSIAS